MKLDRHYHKQVIKVNILSSRTILLHRLPLALFQAVTPYPSQGYSLYPVRGPTPWTGSPLHVDALFTLFGLWYSMSGWSLLPLPHGDPHHPTWAVAPSHHTPLQGMPSLTFLSSDTPHSAAPNMDILLPCLGLCHFTVGYCGFPLSSRVDAYLSLPYLMALETEFFRQRRETRRKEKKEKEWKRKRKMRVTQCSYFYLMMMMMIDNDDDDGDTTLLVGRKSYYGQLRILGNIEIMTRPWVPWGSSLGHYFSLHFGGEVIIW